MGSEKKKRKVESSPEPDEGDDELDPNVFTVDCILSERIDDAGTTQYLLKWQGYLEEESTWEPVQNIEHGAEEIFGRWENDKKRIQQGFQEPFDVDEFERRVEAYNNRHIARPVEQPKAKKSSPKKSRALNQLFMDSDTDDESSDDDIPLVKRKQKTLSSKTQSPVKKGNAVKISTPGKSTKPSVSEGQSRTLDGRFGARKLPASIEKKALDAPNSESKKRKESPSELVKSPPKKHKALPTPPKKAAHGMFAETVKSKPSTEAASGSVVTSGISHAASTTFSTRNEIVSTKDTSRANLGAANPPKVSITAAASNKAAAGKKVERPSDGRMEQSATALPSKSTAARKSVPVRAAATQNVFTFNEPATLRTRKPTEGKIYAPSHVQNIIKKNRDGKAPDAENLVLQTPGEMASRAGKPEDLNPKPITLIAAAASLNPHNKHQQTAPAFPQFSPTAQSIPLLCYYQSRKWKCPDGEYMCRFQHREDPDLKVAAVELHEQVRLYEQEPEKWPKFNTPAIVCGHQYGSKQGCWRQYKCLYAHWKPLTGDWKYHDTTIMDPRKLLTCFYWNKGTCWKSAEECDFAHERLGDVAHIGKMTCPFWFGANYGNGKPCTKGVNCGFAHELTRKVAFNPVTRQEPREIDPALLQAPESWMQETTQPQERYIAAPPPPPPPPPQPQAEIDAGPPPEQEQHDDPVPATEPAPASLEQAPPVQMPTLVQTEQLGNIMLQETNMPVLYTFKLGYGEVEINITIPLRSDVAAFFDASFDGGDRFMKSTSAPIGDVTELTFPVYDEKLEAGKVFPGNDILELAEFADHLAQDEVFLTINSDGRGDFENQNTEPESSHIGFEIRQMSDQKRAELGLPSMQDDHIIPGLTWRDADDLEKDEEEAAELNAARTRFRNTFSMDFTELFRWPTDPPKLKKDIFILMDDDRGAEVVALSQLLRWSGAHVTTPEDDEGWAEFQEKKQGVIIVEDRLSRYQDIPYLANLLFGRYNFFELNTASSRLRLKPLFKTGQTLLLTDQLLQDEPGSVLDIVRYVKEKNRNRAPGSEARRIVARPGVADWLLDQLEQDISGDEALLEARRTLWDEFQTLMPIDSPRDIHDFTDCVIYEPWDLRGLHSKAYEDDPEGATRALIDSFNDTFCKHREVSRNWIVLHPKGKSFADLAEDLAEQYCNLNFMTADNYKTKVMNA